MGKYVVAPDRLIARDNGPWGRVKLDFINSYGPAALQATERKWSRVYVDLFAGTGMNVDKETGQMFDGSALRALEISAPGKTDIYFDRVFLVCGNEAEAEALSTRIARRRAEYRVRCPAEKLQILVGDCSDHIDGVLGNVHRKDYVFVFADPEAPKQWPWRSVQSLRARNHESIDLYTLLPLEMGIIRLCSYVKKGSDPRWDEWLTAFFGTDDWRRLVALRITDTKSQQLRAALERLYLDQLSTLWRHARKIRDVRRRGKQGLYRMLFATDEPVGDKIAKWVADHPDDQIQLL